MSTVIIYSLPTCPHCIRVKKYLDEHHIAYVAKDVSADKAIAKEMIIKSQRKSVPVLDIDGQIIVGFDKQKIDMLLGIA